MSDLTPKQAQFVREYLIDLNATQAAIRAGYSVKTAQQMGDENLSKPVIGAMVQAAILERSKKTEITAERVLEELWAIATADPNELIQWRIGPCDECWKDQESMEVPNCACEACRGEGRGRSFAADTRTLSEAGKRLYAGVKVTKDGLEIKMHDKAAALVNVGRHLGMFKDKVEHSGGLTMLMAPGDEKA